MLSSGGFQTMTMKLNLNQYSDCAIWQHKHVWYVSYGDSGKLEFEDGIEFKGEPTKSNLWVCPQCADGVAVEDDYEDDYDDIPYCTDCSRQRIPVA